MFKSSVVYMSLFISDGIWAVIGTVSNRKVLNGLVIYLFNP